MRGLAGRSVQERAGGASQRVTREPEGVRAEIKNGVPSARARSVAGAGVFALSERGWEREHLADADGLHEFFQFGPHEGEEVFVGRERGLGRKG